MHIKRIRLINFRNYRALDFAPSEGLCVLIGENAAGKTNVLEAVYLLALGRSHRTRHDNELITMGEQGGMVSVTLDTRTGTHNIACKFRSDERKRLEIDHMPLTRSGELLGRLNAVLFAPEDLRLIKQGPAERRRFVDMELSKLQPRYYYQLQQYNLALKQRNALLKSASSVDDAMLDIWDEQLASLGADIVAARARFLEQLGELAGPLHTAFSGAKETLTIAYRPQTAVQEESLLMEELYRSIKAHQKADQLRGTTSVGPHRDDVAILLNGVDARTYGSQGQQRTAALSLKLSQMRLMHKTYLEPPVVLLDDVLSELDSERQRMLADTIVGCQTFLTCTHLAGIAQVRGPMQVYRVAQGAVCVENR